MEMQSSSPISPLVHQQVENLISVPTGTPPTDSVAPKVPVTQEQINYWVSRAGDMWPTIKKYWQTIVVVSTMIGAIGGMVGKSLNLPTVTPVEVVKPVEQPKPEEVKTVPTKTSSANDSRIDALEKALGDTQKQLKDANINQQMQLELIKTMQKTIGGTGYSYPSADEESALRRVRSIAHNLK